MTPTADFDRILESAAFLSEPVIVLAVSGGSDSTALLFRTKEKVSPATRLVAVTVDHALRPESAGEAAGVAALCARREVEHKTLRWDGDKPATGLMAAARLARYALLAKAATDLGSRVVLTGHTADDQAETIAMRMQRGEGMGLAGIAPLTLYERKVWFARPQLDERRATLRDDLRRRGIGWIDDPSNKNETFERVRVRRDLSGRTGEDFDRLIEIGARAASERIELGRQAARVIDRHARLRGNETEFNLPPPLTPPLKGEGDSEKLAIPSPLRGGVRGGGNVRADAALNGVGLDALLLEHAEEVAVHALRILLAVVGGTEQLPDRQRAADLLQRLRETQDGRFSLARTVITKRKSEVLLTRERRGKGFAGDAEGPTMRSPWTSLLPWFDMEPARAVDELLGKTPPPALPWP